MNEKMKKADPKLRKLPSISQNTETYSTSDSFMALIWIQSGLVFAEEGHYIKVILCIEAALALDKSILDLKKHTIKKLINHCEYLKKVSQTQSYKKSKLGPFEPWGIA